MIDNGSFLMFLYRILVYPPGQTGAVNITNGDVTRLAPGEFLNDTLIEFGLK
jgi:Ulp1 family protease